MVRGNRLKGYQGVAALIWPAPMVIGCEGRRMKKLMRQIRTTGLIALSIAALPLILIAAIFFRKNRKCAPKELALELNQLAAGDMDGWDEMECVQIEDPRLEAIRQEAMAVHLPFRAEDRQLLTRLASKAAALHPRPRVGRSRQGDGRT
jgi:hypothetical protein